MTWKMPDYERTPTTLHRVLGIACAIIAVIGSAAMCVLIIAGTSLTQSIRTPAMLGVTVVFGALFGAACWALHRFLFTPARPMTPRSVAILLVLMAIGGLVNLAIQVRLHQLR